MTYHITCNQNVHQVHNLQDQCSCQVSAHSLKHVIDLLPTVAFLTNGEHSVHNNTHIPVEL